MDLAVNNPWLIFSKIIRRYQRGRGRAKHRTTMGHLAGHPREAEQFLYKPEGGPIPTLPSDVATVLYWFDGEDATAGSFLASEAEGDYYYCTRWDESSYQSSPTFLDTPTTATNAFLTLEESDGKNIVGCRDTPTNRWMDVDTPQQIPAELTMYLFLYSINATGQRYSWWEGAPNSYRPKYTTDRPAVWYNSTGIGAPAGLGSRTWDQYQVVRMAVSSVSNEMGFSYDDGADYTTSVSLTAPSSVDLIALGVDSAGSNSYTRGERYAGIIMLDGYYGPGDLQHDTVLDWWAYKRPTLVEY